MNLVCHHDQPGIKDPLAYSQGTREGRTRCETLWRLITHRPSEPAPGHEMYGGVQSGIPRMYPWGGSNGDNGTGRLRHICRVGKSMPQTLRASCPIVHEVPVSCSCVG